jgi:hypothetical protein
MTARHELRSRRGVAAVEFALTFPVVALLLLGGLEFGWYFSRLAMVNSAAHDGARYGAQQVSAGAQRTLAEAGTLTMLEDMGFDCAELDCDVRARRLRTATGLWMVTLELTVEYDQLTGVVPGGSSGNNSALSRLFFQAPNTLRAYSVATVVTP